MPSPAVQERQDQEHGCSLALARRWHLVTALHEHRGPHGYMEQSSGAGWKAGGESRRRPARLFLRNATAVLLQKPLLRWEVIPDHKMKQKTYQNDKIICFLRLILPGSRPAFFCLFLTFIINKPCSIYDRIHHQFHLLVGKTCRSTLANFVLQSITMLDVLVNSLRIFSSYYTLFIAQCFSAFFQAQRWPDF